MSGLGGKKNSGQSATGKLGTGDESWNHGLFFDSRGSPKLAQRFSCILLMNYYNTAHIVVMSAFTLGRTRHSKRMRQGPWCYVCVQHVGGSQWLLSSG